jgi:hypothetical protein
MDEVFLREDIEPSLRISSIRESCLETVADMQVSHSSKRAGAGQEMLFEVENGDGQTVKRVAIGIGETVARPPLPHDRTCGSASGGSAG